MGHTTTRTRENQTITINFRDVTATAGAANGKRVRRWFQDKKAGWYAVFADPQMPATSVLLD